MKVLVVKRDKIGDLLLTTPLFAQLKASRPGVELHLLANDYNAWVVEGNPHIDRLWVYRRALRGVAEKVSAAIEWLRLRARLRGERFDWALVGNGDESPRAIERALAVRAARTAAYCSRADWPAVSDALPVRRDAHEVERLLGLLEPLGVAPAAAPLPQYVLPEASAAFARAWLAERNLAPRAYVVLGLGARRAKKQPGAAQVLRWCAHFKRAWGLDTVFMWTPGKAEDAGYPGDDATAQPVLDARAPHVHPHRGPIREALGLIWSARASLFPDSGLMHFAAASPGGVLGLFAETDVSPSPVQWAPRGPRALWLEAAKDVSELADELVYERLSCLAAP